METPTSPFDAQKIADLVQAVPKATPYTLPEVLIMAGAFAQRRENEYKPDYGGSGMRVQSVSVEQKWDTHVAIRMEGDYGYDTQKWWRVGYMDPADGKFTATDGFN